MATFYNQATLSYNDTVTNSNIVTGELVEVLTAEKTAVTDTYTTGATVTYVVSIVNTGAVQLTGVTVTDDLGAYPFGASTLTPLTYIEGTARLFVNGAVQPVPAVAAGTSLVISGITIPAGGNALVVYQTRANSYAPLGNAAEITNTATVTAAGIANPVIAQETIAADVLADLTITKSLSPEVVTENGELTYNFVIQNTGNTPVTAAHNAVVTDNFEPVLDLISVTFNGVTWSEPANYTYDETAGAFATVAGQLTVPAATYYQDPTTGVWVIEPGVSVLRVTGRV